MPPPQGAWNPVEGPGDFTMTKIVHNDTYPAIDPATTADMTGKSVFIAGASRGIGKAIALSFAKAGASQIIIGARSDLSSVADGIKAAAIASGRNEPKVLSVEVDIADEVSVGAAFQRIDAFTNGRLDVLINNAGLIDMCPLGDSEPSTWWRVFTVNVFGPYLVTRAAIPLLLKSTLKTVITTSSVGAHSVTPTVSAYQTSKLAVVRLMEFVKAENPDIITMSIHPGNTLTDMVNIAGMDERFKSIFTETVEIAADSLVFLSKERREWLSGRYINCTWDLPELVSEEKKREIIEKDMLKVKLVV